VEKRIKNRYSQTILQEALRRYGITQDQIQSLDGFESFIYEITRGTESYILRIGHTLRRSKSLILGEVDWINYLAEGGTPVSRAILSKNGNLVESIKDGHGEQFLATAFTKAKGRPPEKAAWTPSLFETYGQLLGTMHVLSKHYQPPELSWKRPEWNDNSTQEIVSNLPPSEAIIVKKYMALLDYLNTLPKDNESYGLVHYDAHGANFFVDDEGNITLFDFDDCVYSWFINDIAIVLFYAITGRQDTPAFAREFMTHFLQGYKQKNQLDPKWLKEIPHFLKLREIDLYAVIHRSFDVENLDDPWVAGFMQNRKYKIEHDIPYIDFDFESLAPYLR